MKRFESLVLGLLAVVAMVPAPGGEPVTLAALKDQAVADAATSEGKAYLTQSGQLYGEAGAMSLGKVYVFGPTFRAEKSKTRRHLTEFWMVEPEVAFNDLNDNMDLAEEFLEYIVQTVLKNRQQELKTLERNTSLL